MDSKATQLRKQRRRAHRRPLLSVDGGAAEGVERSLSASSAPSPSPPPTSSAPPPSDDFPSVSSQCVRTFRGLHHWSIHSVSCSSDGSTFLSADDLRLLLFDLRHTEEAVQVVDAQDGGGGSADGGGGAADDLLTVARFHPSHPSLLLYGSSNGAVRLADLRLRLSWPSNSSVAAFSAAAAAQPSTAPTAAPFPAQGVQSCVLPLSGYYRSITDSVLDVRWLQTGGGGGGASDDLRFLVTRDFFLLRVWDVRRLHFPVYTSHVQPHLLSSLPLLLECEALFDSFQVAASPDGRQMVSGGYHNTFTLHDVQTQSTVTVQAKDDAREPDVVHRLHNIQLQHSVLRPSPPPPPADFSQSIVRSYVPPLPPSAQLLFGGHVAPAHPSSAGASSPSSPSLAPASLAQKVLKVAWHPRINALAVAGLYKLFLYQQHQPSPPPPEAQQPPP